VGQEKNMTTIPNNVIHRYATKNSLHITDAIAVFGELESFLKDASVSKLSPSKTVDSAWHEFILHTKQYTDYCKDRFGRYIHHMPNDGLISEDFASCHDCSTSCSGNG
jgi:hypothetical protein